MLGCCPTNYQCNIICDAENACRGMDIIWPTIPEYGSITCDGSGSCYGINFPIPPADEPYTLECDAQHECNAATITCPTNNRCDIVCSEYSSCRMANIICPTNGACTVSCLYAAHVAPACGNTSIVWSNLDTNVRTLICDPIDACYGVNQPLSNAPTPSPTFNPTPSPTFNPTPSPTYDTMNPTGNPTYNPTNNPTETPTNNPTHNPTNNPTPGPARSPNVSLSATATFNIAISMFVGSIVMFLGSIVIYCKCYKKSNQQNKEQLAQNNTSNNASKAVNIETVIKPDTTQDNVKKQQSIQLSDDEDLYGKPSVETVGVITPNPMLDINSINNENESDNNAETEEMYDIVQSAQTKGFITDKGEKYEDNENTENVDEVMEWVSKMPDLPKEVTLTPPNQTIFGVEGEKESV